MEAIGGPVSSMDGGGQIVWARGGEYQTLSVDNPDEIKKLGTCSFRPRILKHDSDGTFVAVCGSGFFEIYNTSRWNRESMQSELALWADRAPAKALDFAWSSRGRGECAVLESAKLLKLYSNDFKEKERIAPVFSVQRIFGGTLLGLCSEDGIYFYDWAVDGFIEKVDVNVQNLYWAHSGVLVAIAGDSSFCIYRYNPEAVSALDSGRTVFESLYKIDERVITGIWARDYFCYIDSSCMLKYYFNGEVTAMKQWDRAMFLLGYIVERDTLYLIDEFKVTEYKPQLSLIEYKRLVEKDLVDEAEEVLPSIPPDLHNSLAEFMKSRGMIEKALEFATHIDLKFKLAMQLEKVDIAKEIAKIAKSELKWKEVGELALKRGKFDMAGECMKLGGDLSGLLMLYSSTGDAEGLSELATRAKELGRFNIAFACLFTLGKVEDCIQLLIDSNRIPEAAIMARSYLPSKVSEIVTIWRRELEKVNPTTAEALADPEKNPEMFEHLDVALRCEKDVAESRSIYPPAYTYKKGGRETTTPVEDVLSQMPEMFENLDLEVDYDTGQRDPKASEALADPKNNPGMFDDDDTGGPRDHELRKNLEKAMKKSLGEDSEENEEASADDD